MSTDSTKEAMRYDPVEYGYTGAAMTGQMVQDVDGSYVKHDDYAALLAAIQQDKARIDELTGLVQELVDAANKGVFPNSLSSDEVALLAMNNAGSQKSIDTASEIANDYRASQDAMLAALSKAKQRGFTPSTQMTDDPQLSPMI